MKAIRLFQEFSRDHFGGLSSHNTPLLATQGRYEEADRLYLEAIKIGEKTLGPDHPLLATRLSNRAELLRTQVGAAVVRGFPGGSMWMLYCSSAGVAFLHKGSGMSR